MSYNNPCKSLNWLVYGWILSSVLICRLCQESYTCQCTEKINVENKKGVLWMSSIFILPSSFSLLHSQPPFCLILNSSSLLYSATKIPVILPVYTSQLSPASVSPLVQHQSASQLFPESAYQSTSPLMQQSPLNFNLRRNWRCQSQSAFLLDYKVPSLIKLQDRVDVLSLLPHGMHLLDYLCF